MRAMTSGQGRYSAMSVTAVDPWYAVVDATGQHLRPILLTASAAILRGIPIAPTVFWGPMAYTS
jgi:multidrug efflux pump subunit AcrB